MHNVDLILTLTLGFSAALVLGYVTQRLGLSPILGYLLAGIAAGPYTPGPVADARLAAQLAEVGVILLMFGVGLHFHLKDLLAVKAIAIPGALGQSLVATVLGAFIAWSSGWTLGSGVVLGIAIAVASTVVLMRVLVDNRSLDTPHGHVAVGWLIVEDILTVLVLVLLPVVAGSAAKGGGAAAVAGSLGLALLKIGALVFLVLVVGSRVIPWILTQVARTRSRELFTLAVLALALVVATGSAVVFGASMALGAFLAGMVVGQSKVSEQAAADALPMRDAFAVLFFVSVGMLFDPRFLLQQPLLVLAVLGVILVAKPLVALAIVLGLGYSVRTALTVALGLAQIGEFSFILADQAKGILPPAGGSVLVACALLSISVNPLLFRMIGPLEARLRRRKKLWALLNRRAEARVKAAPLDPALHPRAVVVGYGPVGQVTRRILESFGIRSVVVDLNVDTVNRLRAEGVPAVYGDAAKSDILQAAGVEKAKYLVVTLPDLVARLPVLISARELNPDLLIFSRARYLAERGTLEEFGVTAVCYEEAESASGLAEFLLRAEGAPEDRIEKELDGIAAELAVPRRRPG
ncbi:MAG TPA: cation:proton antiporter [Planctomycetota bacterium]